MMQKIHRIELQTIPAKSSGFLPSKMALSREVSGLIIENASDFTVLRFFGAVIIFTFQDVLLCTDLFGFFIINHMEHGTQVNGRFL